MRPRRVTAVAPLAALALLGAVRVGRAGTAPGWTARFGLEEAYNDNVRQRSTAPFDDDFITTIRAALAWKNPQKHSRLPRAVELAAEGYVYANLESFDYVELRPSTIYPLPWRVDLLLEYSYSPRQLLFDEGGTAIPAFYRENVISGGLLRRFGARKQLRTALGFSADWDDYRKEENQRDSFTSWLVTDVRYRFDLPTRFVTSLTPRCGLEYGARNAHRDNFDRNELELTPGVELQLARGARWRFRYERSARDYTVGEFEEFGTRQRANNNFGREDSINEYETWLAIPLAMVPGLWLGARYRFRDGVFDEPNRRRPPPLTGRGVTQRFDVHEIGLSVDYEL